MVGTIRLDTELDHLRPSMRPVAPIGLVLGTNDIASAIGWHLHRNGYAVLLLRDGGTPVLRRGMSFDDALESGEATLDGVTAVSQRQPPRLPGREGPLVSREALPVVLAAIPAGAVRLLVDARLRKYADPEDLRLLADRTIGVGPGFVAGENVYVAVESLPGAEGQIVTHGATALPSGKSVPLGGAGNERFVYAPRAGAWAPRRVPGDAVQTGDILGALGEEDLVAPVAGRIRGLVRPRMALARGTKLAEIDPRPHATWQGIPARAERIARGVLLALTVDEHLPTSVFAMA